MHILYAIIFLPGKVINFFKSLHSELLKLLQTGLCTSIIDVGYLGANLSERWPSSAGISNTRNGHSDINDYRFKSGIRCRRVFGF